MQIEEKVASPTKLMQIWADTILTKPIHSMIGDEFSQFVGDRQGKVVEKFAKMTRSRIEFPESTFKTPTMFSTAAQMYFRYCFGHGDETFTFEFRFWNDIDRNYYVTISMKFLSN
jgi:hypothetical protein